MMSLGLLYWLVFGALLTLVCGPLRFLLPERQGQRLGRFFLHHLFRKFVVLLRWADLVHADLRALDALKNVPGPFIAAPNHTSLWDAVFVIARLPQAVCVMKKEILHNPLLCGGARLAGYLANDSMPRLIRSAAASLAGGGQLLLFPEGTRTRPDERFVNPLKGGCAIVAIRAGVPIYPVLIRSDSRFAQKGWPLWRRPEFPIRMRLDLGEPVTAAPGETAQQLTARLAAIYESELSKPHPLRRQTG